MSIKILSLRQFSDQHEASADVEGEIRFVTGCTGPNRSRSNPHGLNSQTSRLRQGMCICHKHYGKYKWTDLNDLSKTNKLHFSNSIETAFRNHCISQNLNVDMGAGTYYDMQQECQKLELEVRKKNLEMETLRASVKVVMKKKTCVIEGCPGMCAADFDEYNKEDFEECFCCKKKQELECPICYDVLSVSNMIKGAECAHRICWKCYGRAYQGGNPIKCCPMCRSQFGKKK
jgi:hypothetical protein